MSESDDGVREEAGDQDQAVGVDESLAQVVVPIIAAHEIRARCRNKIKAQEVSPIPVGAEYVVPKAFLDDDDEGNNLPFVTTVRGHYSADGFGLLKPGEKVKVFGISPNYGVLCIYLGNVENDQTKDELGHGALFFLPQAELESWPDLVEQQNAEDAEVQAEVDRLLAEARKQLGDTMPEILRR